MSAPPLVPVDPCTNQDVADLLRARTKDSNGTEQGKWTTDTRPTPAEVDNLITLAHGDVVAQTGAELDTRLAESARSMIALRAAMLVELSYWPEQVRSDRSAYPEYWRLYTDGMTALLDSIESGGAAVDQFTFGSLPVRSWTRTAVYDFAAAEAPAPAPLVEEFATLDEALGAAQDE